MPQTKNHHGFTLTEVLVSVLILGILAGAFTVPYISGFQSLDVQADHMLLDSHLRSRMEVLVSTELATLINGSEVITIAGQNYTISWNVVPIDLDGDATPEPNAVQVTVSVAGMPGRSFTTIVVDHEGRLGDVL